MYSFSKTWIWELYAFMLKDFRFQNADFFFLSHSLYVGFFLPFEIVSLSLSLKQVYIFGEKDKDRYVLS